MKGKLILVLLIFCSTMMGQGQNSLSTIGGSLSSLESFSTSYGRFLMRVIDPKDIEGTPYLFDEFDLGRIHMNGIWYDELKLRYDVYHGRFEVRFENGDFIIDPLEQGVDTIECSGDVFIRKDLGKKESISINYLAILSDQNKFLLLKKYRKKFKEALPAACYQDPAPAEYKKYKPAYYIFHEDRSYEIKGVKTMSEIFEVDVKAVKRFMKKNKYKLSVESDLIETVNHFAV